jgi:hypothetical protein
MEEFVNGIKKQKTDAVLAQRAEQFLARIEAKYGLSS